MLIGAGNPPSDGYITERPRPLNICRRSFNGVKIPDSSDNGRMCSNESLCHLKFGDMGSSETLLRHAHLRLELYQCNTQRVSRNTINNSTRAQSFIVRGPTISKL